MILQSAVSSSLIKSAEMATLEKAALRAADVCFDVVS